MSPALESTSVPAWAIRASCPAADTSGRCWTAVAIGDRARQIVTDWTAQILSCHPGAEMRAHIVAEDDHDAACDAITADLTHAVVGWRLMIAGPADACLRLRAHALRCGVADDEITVASTAVGVRAVHCAHCGTLTRAEVDLEDVVTCTGCDRELLVYYHVSRRLGAHLGFTTGTTESSAQ